MAPTQNQISIFHISLDRKAIQIIPNTLFSLFSSSPLGFRPCLSFSPLVRSLYPLFLHAFHAFRPRFWVYLKFLGFSKIDVYFVKFLGWVLCFWCNMIMHCIQFAFSQCFMYLNVCLYAWKLCADSFGLGWTHDAIMFSTSNLYAFFMHTYPIFSLFLVLCCDGVFLFVSLSISLSLSLFRIVCAWHQSINPLCLGTLFILGHLLLILLLFTSSSVIRRPIRTSRRTSPTIVFI